ncbi:hypothetical protein BR121_05755 [Salmonella enterica]|nr:hypothetical protein [Salmonella enterica]EBU4185635.1 hypothetical protein [Salmonella enterica]ECS6042035.1 hypothetical protein [Salmonella enterica]EEJ7026360.1 hypothetical protein [Salmonella enterica]EGJ2373997.1 hypothetical protein [Salmonella enterica]
MCHTRVRSKKTPTWARSPRSATISSLITILPWSSLWVIVYFLGRCAVV